jgi:Cu2+-exporting ATPase
MFIEVCLLCAGLYSASKVANKKEKIDLDTVDTAYQGFVRKKIDPLFTSKRDRQVQVLTGAEDIFLETCQEEKQTNRRLGVSAVNLSLALVSNALYPPALLLTVPATLCLSLCHFKKAYYSIFKKNKVDVAVLDAIIEGWSLLAGYFFVSALSIFLFTLSEKLLSKTKASSKKKLASMYTQHPCSVWVYLEGTEFEVPFEEVKANDIVVVNAGEIIPADGTIRDGIASIDQRILTGEFQPAEKSVGEQVFASTVVLSGKIYIQVEKTGKETVALKLADILSNTTEYKTNLDCNTKQFVDQSSLPTLVLSGLAYPVAGASGSLAILLSSIGYNMRIFSPLTILNFLHLTSQHGILIKKGYVLEKFSEVDTVLFDKTGTLTLEQPVVHNIYSCKEIDEDELLLYAAAAEYRQTHPVAKALLAAADARNLKLPEIESSQYEIGYGIKVFVDGRIVRVGSERFMAMEKIAVPAEIKEIHQECGRQGHSFVMIAINGELSGAIELAPAIRPEAEKVIKELRQRKIVTFIISGDQEHATRILAERLQVDHYIAEVLPEEKSAIVEELQQKGKTVCFVGDGINDSIALKKADVSISLRGAATSATDTAQIVLMDEKLTNIGLLLDLAKKFEERQANNLITTIVPGVICIGGVFLSHVGIYTSMMLFYGSLAIGIFNATKPVKK